MSSETDTTFRNRIFNSGAIPWHSGWIGVYCLVLAAAFLLVCTKSSPLYPFNDWVDANSFFTMGKGMFNGKVLYRDLFEQKGPLLYFLHGLASLVSDRTFFGVFLLEVMAFGVFLFYGQRLMRLFTSDGYALAALPGIAFAVLNSIAFAHGDSAEEFCLPLLTISLYHLLRAFRTARPPGRGFAFAEQPGIQIFTRRPGVQPFVFSDRLLLLNGIIAGCVLWIKFSLLAFWAAWLLVILLNSGTGRTIAQTARSLLSFGFGVLLATLPWLYYFGSHQALGDWFETYFLVNIRYYPAVQSFVPGLVSVAALTAYNAVRNPLISLPLLGGVYRFSRTGTYVSSFNARMSVVACVVLLAFGIYGGGRSYNYYFLIAAPFSILGFICLERILPPRVHWIPSARQTRAVLLILAIALVLATRWLNPNAGFMETRKEDLVQYQFAAVINQSPDATLLNYGFLDMGFYTTAGLTPDARFFQKQNIDERIFPLNMAEQNRSIAERATEYVVLRQEAGKGLDEPMYPAIHSHYDLVMVRQQTYEDVCYDYCLFRRKA